MIKSRLLKGLLLTFCCWHSIFLVVSIIPAKPARDEPGNSVLDLYWLLFAGKQLWNMFDNIPTLHSLDVRIEGETSGGERITLGSVLPGFQPYPKPEDSRYFTAYYRLISLDLYRDAYLQNLADRLPALEEARDGRNWALVVDAEHTRLLDRIRRDGQVSVPASRAFELPAARSGPP